MTEHGQPPFQPEHSLPADLREWLAAEQSACLIAPTADGAVFVVKLPGQEIDQLRGPVPMLLQHELYLHPQAPVLRTVTYFYDDPRNPFVLDAYTNVADADQRDTFLALGERNDLHYQFYDEQLAHRVTKALPNRAPELFVDVVIQAEEHAAGIAEEQYDFDAAKRAVEAAVNPPPEEPAPMAGGAAQKRYRGFSEDADSAMGPEAVFVQQDEEPPYRLPNDQRHSMEFSWGYSGSGPAQLARSILADHLGTSDPHPALYQRFKAAFVARFEQGKPWQITSEEIGAFLAKPEMQALLEDQRELDELRREIAELERREIDQT